MNKKIFNNMGLKILSVAIAISLWFFVTYRGQSEMVIDAPIEFKNVPERLELLKQNIKVVSLNISGHERLLKGLNPMAVRVVIDLANAKKGETLYYFDKNNVVIHSNIKVLRMDPMSVRVTLDESISKIVPVRVNITGVPESGYRIKSVKARPLSVEVEGAKIEIDRIFVLRTESLDISGLNSSTIQNVKLNTEGKNIRTKNSEISVEVIIEKVKK
ncbi:MAG: CdaR family protein [Thermodesulfovibrionales bacterium]|nr:CdaR family protein [Thermodesulfovibrionales bacterium]